MAYNKSGSASNNNSQSQNTERKALGYLNISILTADGTQKRLNGGRGLVMNAGNALEEALHKFCVENPDRVQELTGRLVLTYGEATDPDAPVDLGL